MGELKRGRRWRSCLGLVAAVVILTGGSGSAQVPSLGTYHALVIGNQAYRELSPLKTPLADAQAVAELLRRDYGFRVRLLSNATRADMIRALDDLRRTLRESDNLLVYYAGHGWLDRDADRGYWLPVDAEPNSRQNWLSNADVTDTLRALKAKHVLVVTDSCYAGTLTRDVAVRPLGGEDLVRLAQKKARTALTSGGLEPVLDVGGGRHSVFAKAFLDALRSNSGTADLASLFSGIRRQVLLHSEQTPQYSDIRQAGHDGGDFIFARPGAQLAAVPPAAPQAPSFTEEIVKELGSLAISATVPGVEVLLGGQRVGEVGPGRRLTSGQLEAGVYRIRARKTGYKDWEREVRVVANQRSEVVIDLEALGLAKVVKGDDGAEMVLVPAGEFTMGSTRTEVDRAIGECRKYSSSLTEAECKGWHERELPQHRVLLDAFYIDGYETTNALFQAFVKATGHQTTAERQGDGWVWQQKDGKWQWLPVSGASWRAPTGPRSSAAADHPVVQVSWGDAEAYCKWAGKRLPTEAEWEKAARGTDARRYPWGEEWAAVRANGDMAVQSTRPVGSYPGGVSPYGVHDMAGNVAEWIADWLDASYYERSPERNPKGPDTGTLRVLRGGSWRYAPLNLRTADRHGNAPGYRRYALGFRCAKGAS